MNYGDTFAGEGDTSADPFADLGGEPVAGAVPNPPHAPARQRSATSATVSSRRIVPPPMPAPNPQAVGYVPPTFECPADHTRTQSLLLWGGCGIAVVIAVAIVVYMASPAKPYVPSQYQAAKALVEATSADAQPAAARTPPASGSDTNSAGATSWTGTLRLDEENASISVRVFPAGSDVARRYATTDGKHPAVAILTIDNSASIRGVLLDASRCHAEYAGGAPPLAALNALGVTQNPPPGTQPTSAGATPSTEPVLIAAHEQAAKAVFFPPTLDLVRLRGITLNINLKPATINGDPVGSGTRGATVADATTRPAN
jgi:hypothetical protein